MEIIYVSLKGRKRWVREIYIDNTRYINSENLKRNEKGKPDTARQAILHTGEEKT